MILSLALHLGLLLALAPFLPSSSPLGLGRDDRLVLEWREVPGPVQWPEETEEPLPELPLPPEIETVPSPDVTVLPESEAPVEILDELEPPEDVDVPVPVPDVSGLAGIPVRRAPVEQSPRPSEPPSAPAARARPAAPPPRAAPAAASAERGRAVLRPILRPKPAYPPDLQRAGVEGYAVVHIVVEADGSVSEARLARSSGHGAFDVAAVASLRGWRFEPPGRQLQTDVRVRFRLR